MHITGHLEILPSDLNTRIAYLIYKFPPADELCWDAKLPARIHFRKLLIVAYLANHVAPISAPAPAAEPCHS